MRPGRIACRGVFVPIRKADKIRVRAFSADEAWRTAGQVPRMAAAQAERLKSEVDRFMAAMKR